MKKLMIAASAALCAAVSFGAALTSANTVGYASNQLDDDYGSVLLTPQFVGVANAGGLTLGNIRPVSSSDEYTVGDGDVDIQFLDNGGYTIEDKWFVWDGAKWVYMNGGADASSFVIPVGAGVSVACGVDPDDAIITLQSLGEVATSDTLISLDEDYGSVIAGNPYPVSRTLGQFALEVNEGSDYEIGDGDVDIQFLDNGGYTIEDKWFVWDGAKWVYMNGGADASSFEIKSGEAVSVACGVDPDDAIVTLRIPAPAL